MLCKVNFWPFLGRLLAICLEDLLGGASDNLGPVHVARMIGFVIDQLQLCVFVYDLFLFMICASLC